MIPAIRQQWRDYWELTTNEDPIKRWAWPGGPIKSGRRWLQLDLWVTPGRIIGLDISRDSDQDSYALSESWATTLTIACLSLVLSLERWTER